MWETTYKIGSREISDENLFFIIEEGQANLGDFKKALLMIDNASETGADAIEFQLALADDFYVKNHPGYEIYKKREFDNSQLADLIYYTKDRGLEFIASPLSHKLITTLTKLGCSGFNVNASDLINPDIIDAVIESGLPFFLSLPLATEKEIDWAIDRISPKGNSNFSLMLGQHTMASGEGGVDVEHTNLGYISTLREKYDVPIGFIDHSPLIWMPAAAVAASANIVSKHLAISISDKGPDWQVCLELEEMKQAINWARKMRISINNKEKKLAPGENLDRSKMRRSIVAAKIIKKNKIIQRDDIVFKRPGTGIEPNKFNKIIGKVSLRTILKDEQIQLSDLQLIKKG